MPKRLIPRTLGFWGPCSWRACDMKRFAWFEAGLFGAACWVTQPALAQAQEPAPPAPPAAAPAAPEATTTPAAESVTGPAPVVAGEPPATLPAEPEAKPSSPPVSAGAEAPSAAAPAPATSAAPVAVAAAAAPQDSETRAGVSGKLGSHQDHWLAWIGVRNDYVRDASFDLFASNDALTVFSVGAGRTLWLSGNFSLAALGFWEIGSRSEDTRGNEMSLRVQR